MPSISVQCRIDSQLWESIRHEGESNTQLLQRLVEHYTATDGEGLRAIAPTPAAAVATLLNSHKLLFLLAGKGAIAFPDLLQQKPDLPPTAETTESAHEKTALESANDF
jgi:hypothetical protein